MIPQYLLCDICGERIEMDTSLFIETDGYLDSDGDWKGNSVSMDLCPRHVKELIQTFLKDDLNDKICHKMGQKLVNVYNYMKENND